MSDRVKKYIPRLKLLSKASPHMRKAILANCDKGTMQCICECAKNVLKGNVPINREQMQKLRRHKKSLRELVRKKTSLQKKRRIVQTGGFIGAIIAPVLSALGSVLFNRGCDGIRQEDGFGRASSD